MDVYILDTNIFFNMEAGLNLGKTTEEVVKTITKAAQKLKDTDEAQMLLPPRIVEEFLSFFENKNEMFIQEFLGVISSQSPSFHEMSVPAAVVYQLVEDIRYRSYRGLTIGEEEIQNGAKDMIGIPELSKKDFQIRVGTTVRSFRDRYRQATRFGFLDSVADLDLIMLSKQTNGVIISTDEGVVKWGRVMGVREMSIPAFGEKIRKALRQEVL